MFYDQNANWLKIVFVWFKCKIDLQKNISPQAFWLKWWQALKAVFPLYVALHAAILVITLYSTMFIFHDFSHTGAPLYRIWQTWHRWDTQQYINIATRGYSIAQETAFFPLYSICERLVFYVTHNFFIAGLLIANSADLVMLVVFYQLVLEDFDKERAERAILYLALFPTAFFFLAAYNESFFLCIVLISFYNLRHGNWWIAGIFGFLAAATRSSGLFLTVPFLYEYMRQHQFNLRRIRFDIVSCGFIPAAVALFSVFCYWRFHDFLSFSHAEALWLHVFRPPWYGMIVAIQHVFQSPALQSFEALRTMTDLVPDLLMLLMIILCLVGPWRLPRTHLVYVVYAAVLYIFLQLFPLSALMVLQSVGRYMLEIFPAFIIMASIGKSRLFHLNYLFISGAIFFFLLTQFLLNRWVI